MHLLSHIWRRIACFSEVTFQLIRLWYAPVACKLASSGARRDMWLIDHLRAITESCVPRCKLRVALAPDRIFVHVSRGAVETWCSRCFDTMTEYHLFMCHNVLLTRGVVDNERCVRCCDIRVAATLRDLIRFMTEYHISCVTKCCQPLRLFVRCSGSMTEITYSCVTECGQNVCVDVDAEWSACCCDLACGALAALES